MKHLFLSIALLCALSTFSQETTEKTIKKNEIKINLLYFILDFPEITYERLLTDQTVLGVSVAFPIESGASMLGNDLNFIMNPYYRVYFGEKPNTGFFCGWECCFVLPKKNRGRFFYR